MTSLLALGGTPGGDAVALAARSLGPVTTSPPMVVARAGALAARLWSRGDAERIIHADIAQRALSDRAVALQVRRARPSLVVARSLAARHTLAAARAIGAATVLVLDLPVLRQLAADLDRAAARWPERRFLRRVRPSSEWIAEQEAEWLLADAILVRGAYGRALLQARGVPATAIAPLPPAADAPMLRAVTPTGRVRLAGLATARHGLDVARAACASLGLTLVVRIGQGTEPRDLAALPGIATDDAPVDAVLCPALCEAYPAELAAARGAGVPVVVSRGAAQVGDQVVDPYDAADVTTALASALGAWDRRPAPGPPDAPLANLLRGLIERRPLLASHDDVAAATSCSV